MWNFEGEKFRDILIDFLRIKLLWKGVYSKRKELVPHGGKFFPLREDLFTEFYENTPIQVYRKFHLQNLKKRSDKNSDIFISPLKT